MAGREAAPADLVVAAARRWLGTPYVRRAALCGSGCDCVGLIRGVLADLTGRPAPDVPAWRADWAAVPTRPLVEAARRHLIAVPAGEAARVGNMAIMRQARGLEAHCGILAPSGRFIHTTEQRGVVEVHLSTFADRISYLARFPAA